MIEVGRVVTYGEHDIIGVVTGYDRKNDTPYWAVQWNCHEKGHVIWYEPWKLKTFIPKPITLDEELFTL